MMQTYPKNPKVSVLIPCYNSENYLEQCLNSLEAQSLSEIEFICLNDGSKDSTLAILERYKSRDKRFVVVNKENSGYGDTLNLGFGVATGEYIGIVEPDDFVEPNMFEVLYDMASQYNLDIARCSYYYYSKEGDVEQKWGEVPKNQLICPRKHLAVFKQGPSVWANIYKRSWLLDNQIEFLRTPGASYQDTSFSFKAYFQSSRFMMTDVCLMHYRVDNLNSSVHDIKKVFCVMDEWSEIYRFISSQTKYTESIVVDKLPELQHRTYLWNLGRLDKANRLIFLEKWHEEVLKRKHNLLKLSFLHFIIECIVRFCPYALSLYKKDMPIVKFLKQLS